MGSVCYSYGQELSIPLHVLSIGSVDELYKGRAYNLRFRILRSKRQGEKKRSRKIMWVDKEDLQ
jgi:predicted metal-binding protein